MTVHMEIGRMSAKLILRYRPKQCLIFVYTVTYIHADAQFCALQFHYRTICNWRIITTWSLRDWPRLAPTLACPSGNTSALATWGTTWSTSCRERNQPRTLQQHDQWTISFSSELLHEPPKIKFFSFVFYFIL